MDKKFIFLIVFSAVVLGIVVAYDFWLTLGALVFLFYLVAAWRWPRPVLYVLAAYLPFQIALNLAPDIDLMSGRVLVPALFLVAGLKYFLAGGDFKVFLRNKISLSLLFFFSLTAISFLVAVEHFWALRKILFLSSWLPLYFLMADFIDNEEKSRKLIWVIVLGAATSALVGLGQFLAQFILNRETLIAFWLNFIAPLFSGASLAKLIQTDHSWLVEVSGQVFFRVVGLFPDPHMAAFYLGMAFPFCLALFFFERRYKKITGAVCLLVALAIFLTFSRGGYLGAFFSVAFFLAAIRKFLTKKDKKFLAAAFLFLVFTLFFFSPIGGRFSSIFSMEDGSNLGRLQIWQDSWNLAEDNFLLGVGLGNYSSVLNFAQNYRNAVTSHNLYLDLLVELGILGLLSWFVVIFFAWRAAWRARSREPVVALGVAGALVYFSVHSFFETAIFNPTVLAFLVIYLGLSFRLEQKNVSNN
jgi:O-antigen ligase